MKTEIRIPTLQYGYLNFEFEGTPEEAIAEHNRINILYNGGFGLSVEEFNAALDKYLTDGSGETEVYMQMSKEQQTVFQCVKRSLKRIADKQK
jgi:hypothetical protein